MQVLGKVVGSEIVGIGYQPLFPYFSRLKADSSLTNGNAAAAGAFRVVGDGYVTADNGTGIVHCAPAFGEDDMRVCLANGKGLAADSRLICSWTISLNYFVLMVPHA